MNVENNEAYVVELTNGGYMVSNATHYFDFQVNVWIPREAFVFSSDWVGVRISDKTKAEEVLKVAQQTEL